MLEPQHTRVRALSLEDPLEVEMATHSSILAWEIRGQRSRAGHRPWGRKESDMTERTSSSKQHFFIPHLLVSELRVIEI